MIYFAKDSLMQNISFFFTIINGICSYALNELMLYNYFGELQSMVVFFIDVIIATTALIIIYLEKEQLMGILKLKIPN